MLAIGAEHCASDRGIVMKGALQMACRIPKPCSLICGGSEDMLAVCAEYRIPNFLTMTFFLTMTEVCQYTTLQVPQTNCPIVGACQNTLVIWAEGNSNTCLCTNIKCRKWRVIEIPDL